MTNAALANTVTAYATVLAGVLPLALSALMGGQPRRWLAVYWGIVVTGLATVWYHGFGETFVAGMADGGTNLLLVWLIQVAVLGDFYPRRTRWLIGGVSAALNLAVPIWKLAVGPVIARTNVLGFGAFGGFHLSELVLILDAWLVVALFYARRQAIPPAARPLLRLVTGFFFAGMLLATASNSRVDFGILAYHATWHVVGAFGFIALWAFNHARYRW